MFVRLAEQGGPVTGKGKTRALFNTYLSALDREVKLALALGLRRRTARVGLAEYMNKQRVAGEDDAEEAQSALLANDRDNADSGSQPGETSGQGADERVKKGEAGGP